MVVISRRDQGFCWWQHQMHVESILTPCRLMALTLDWRSVLLIDKAYSPYYPAMKHTFDDRNLSMYNLHCVRQCDCINNSMHYASEQLRMFASIEWSVTQHGHALRLAGVLVKWLGTVIVAHHYYIQQSKISLDLLMYYRYDLAPTGCLTILAGDRFSIITRQ